MSLWVYPFIQRVISSTNENALAQYNGEGMWVGTSWFLVH